MLWTIMPLEAVMEGSGSFQPSYSEIPWQNGGTLLVEPVGPDRARVIRLISTDPNHYLNPDLQPGNVIGLNMLHRTKR